MSEITTSLFVYGTLMPGEPNYRQIGTFVIDHRPGTIDGVLVDLGSFPALIPGQGLVKGVVLELDAAALVIADRIEGYSPDGDRCLYLREEVVVRFEDEKNITAWTYVYARPGSVSECPRLVVGELNGVPLHAWPRLEPSPEKRKREMS